MSTEIIRDLNDRFRAGDTEIPGQIMITSGLAAHLAEAGQGGSDAHAAVQAFDVFTEDVDPHGEHDFGAFEIAGARCYWKLDLYDPSLTRYTDDPTDPAKTVRVLTIMLASEY